MEQRTVMPALRASGRKGLKKEAVCGTAFALIPLVGFLLFSLVPVGVTFVTMFGDMKGYDFSTVTWNGFANFRSVFTDARFGKSLLISAYVTTAHMIGLLVALATSAVLSQKLRGSKFFAALFFVPYICSSVAVALMWQRMFDANYGIVNTILKKLGSENGVNWFNDKWAFTPMLIVVMAWQAPGYGIVMFTAALTGVNPNLYEAARIDGAGRWKQFTAITLPAVSPTTFFLFLMGLINGLQTFDIAKIFAGDSWTGAAGPDDMGLTAVLYIYNEGMLFRNMPTASVMSFALFLIVMAVTIVSFKVSDKVVSYD